MWGEQTLIYVRPVIAFVASLLVSLALRKLMLGWMARRPWRWAIGTVVARTFSLPTFLWAMALSLAIALRFVRLSNEERQWAHDWIGAFVIISLTLVAAAAAVRALTVYGERQEKQFVVAGLSKTLTYVGVWSLGAVVLLNYLNLDKTIAPLLTALGVGGIAVALALQDTLANFFAGIHILVEEPISVGHIIRLSSGEEGTVTDIGWRTTRVLTGQNSTIVIPNTKITSGILVNHSLPEMRVVMQTQILVGHGADPDEVARLAIEVAQATPGILATPPPLVFFDPGVTLTHLGLRLDASVADRNLLGGIQSTLRAALLRRFRCEGIPLPEVPWAVPPAPPA